MLSCVQDFVCHYMHFMEQGRDFDQRLATVLNQAFQDSKNLNSTFKVCIFMETTLLSKAKAPAAAYMQFYILSDSTSSI